MLESLDIRRRRTIGAATWSVGFVVALIWASLDRAGAEGVGYGFAPAVDVASLETAKVLEIPVELHGLVDEGAVVVRMDPAPLLEQREVASAELLAVQDQESRQASSDARRFAEGMESSLVNRAKVAAQVQEDTALLSTLRERQSLEEELAATGASSSQAVEEWRRQIRVVEARIGANQASLGAASVAVEGARTRSATAPSPSEWTVVAASRVLQAVEGRIARMDLKSAIGGQIAWIYHQPGEVVPAGEPIVQIRRTATREVVAFVDATEAVGLEPGGRASVRRSSGQVIGGQLVSVGSGPQPLPVALWRLPSWPEYGVPVRVLLDSEVAPDEPVTVRM